MVGPATRNVNRRFSLSMVLGTPHGVGRTSCRTLPIEVMRLMRSACGGMVRVKAGMGFVGIVQLMIMSPISLK